MNKFYLLSVLLLASSMCFAQRGGYQTVDEFALDRSGKKDFECKKLVREEIKSICDTIKIKQKMHDRLQLIDSINIIIYKNIRVPVKGWLATERTPMSGNIVTLRIIPEEDSSYWKNTNHKKPPGPASWHSFHRDSPFGLFYQATKMIDLSSYVYHESFKTQDERLIFLRRQLPDEKEESLLIRNNELIQVVGDLVLKEHEEVSELIAILK